MICRRCLVRLGRSSNSLPSSRRAISSTSNNAAEAISTKTIEQAKPRQDGGQPSAVSSAAQPFTSPMSVSPTSRGQKPSGKKASDIPTVLSSCQAGTPLRGLNFIKGKNDPVAMEDHEYPEWLWNVLKSKEKDAEETFSKADLYSKSKSKRQRAKRLLKEMEANANTQNIPLYAQTIDLPKGDGTEAGAVEAVVARQELTKAMRQKRRADIKEANFLRTMR